MGEEDRVSKVYFFKEIKKLHQALDCVDISQFSDRKILVKMHMGELKNKYYTRPSFVKRVIGELLKINADPYLYDTTVLYNSPRNKIEGYKKVAEKHGFTKSNVGCSVEIDDKGYPIKIEGYLFEVGEKLHDINDILAISHVKGHVASGMGGAIKNFGMGGVTKEIKRMIHHGSRPVYNKDYCTFCGVCADVCPFDAINIKDGIWNFKERSCFGCGVCVENCSFDALSYVDNNFQYFLACAAKACVDEKRVIYINDVNRISKSCDCDPFADPIICSDIGYLVSNDPVAIDTASLDLINNVKKDVFLKENHIDPYKQVKYGEKIGLGSTDYDLIRI